MQGRTGRYYIGIAALVVFSMLFACSLAFAQEEAEAEPAAAAEAEEPEG